MPNAILLASLPFSDREAGSQQGVKALRALEHYFGRVQALWKPVATEEAFEIVRRRLFANVSDRLGAEDVCKAYADLYAGNSGDFPPETQEAKYLERLKHAYPIHPEVFDRLYEDWSSLDNFQRTRGVLKLMAKVIHRLWTSGNNDLMIQPGSLPLFDADTRNEAIYYLPPGWDPVLERDIDGERAMTTELDNAKPLFGSIHACRRIARAVFLGSAPDAGAVGGAKHHRGCSPLLFKIAVAASIAGVCAARPKVASGDSTTRRSDQSSGTSAEGVKTWTPPKTPLAKRSLSLMKG